MNLKKTANKLPPPKNNQIFSFVVFYSNQHPFQDYFSSYDSHLLRNTANSLHSLLIFIALHFLFVFYCTVVFVCIGQTTGNSSTLCGQHEGNIPTHFHGYPQSSPDPDRGEGWKAWLQMTSA